MSLNLYRVNVRGFSTHFSTGPNYHTTWVIAQDAETAYQLVRHDLKDLGFSDDRELESVELIASEKPYAPIRLIIGQKKSDPVHD